ncbi:MAG: hypothetical protein LBI12_06880 [Treponema sp.]|jgi:hypothetical protein|nr:hypothetical protein [Treponema sp.]
MAKKKAIYAPGELGRVRQKLGVTDDAEAMRMAQVLGGEVGMERHDDDAMRRLKKPAIRDTVEVTLDGKKKGGRRVEVLFNDDDEGLSRSKFKYHEIYPGDDPAIPARLSYGERIKIDQYAGQISFEIKTSFQILTSIFSFFREPVDYVSSHFVTSRMNEYYGKIEKLVTLTRNLFPKNNTKRNNQLKRASPFVYRMLEVMRDWNIEQLAGNIAELQSHPRTVKVTDFAEILRIIYKPLFIFDELSTENIKTAFKLIYKVLYIESPMDAKEKYQDIIRNIITSLIEVRRQVHHGMFPLLMKLISDRFVSYDRFFIERRRRFMAFLIATDNEQLKSADLAPQQIENIDVETLQNNLHNEHEDAEGEGTSEKEPAENPDEDPNDPKVIERKAKQEAEKAERKALEQGRATLEALFPKAGWEKLEEYPDLYPYFANLYSLRHGYELIAPTDPVQQVSVLMNMLDDLFIGLRYVNFGTVTGADGNPARVYDEIGEIVNNWRRYIEDSFSKDYLPRLTEFCRILENSEESRTSPYAKKTINELHWIKRLYFLPYYKFESIGPPPFPKQDIIPVYSLIRKIRKNLTAIGMGIEQGVKAGGAHAKALCNGIHNPWENYNFQIPNPISKRLDAMLSPEKRTNATLVYFTLSVVAVLDYIINNENSWAYGSRPGPLFRSLRDEGIVPAFGVDEKLDADQIFKDNLKKKAAN